MSVNWDTQESTSCLRAVLKWEIQHLLERLAATGEETLLLTVNLENRGLDLLGSPIAQGFLETTELDSVKSRFLEFCTECVKEQGRYIKTKTTTDRNVNRKRKNSCNTPPHKRSAHQNGSRVDSANSQEFMNTDVSDVSDNDGNDSIPCQEMFEVNNQSEKTNYSENQSIDNHSAKFEQNSSAMMGNGSVRLKVGSDNLSSQRLNVCSLQFDSRSLNSSERLTRNSKDSRVAKSVHSLDRTGSVHSADRTGSVQSADRTGSVHSADRTGSVQSADRTGSVHSADRTESVHSEGRTESVYSRTDKTALEEEDLTDSENCLSESPLLSWKLKDHFPSLPSEDDSLTPPTLGQHIPPHLAFLSQAISSSSHAKSPSLSTILPSFSKSVKTHAGPTRPVRKCKSAGKQTARKSFQNRTSDSDLLAGIKQEPELDCLLSACTTLTNDGHMRLVTGEAPLADLVTLATDTEAKPFLPSSSLPVSMTIFGTTRPSKQSRDTTQPFNDSRATTQSFSDTRATILFPSNSSAVTQLLSTGNTGATTLLPSNSRDTILSSNDTQAVSMSPAFIQHNSSRAPHMVKKEPTVEPDELRDLFTTNTRDLTMSPRDVTVFPRDVTMSPRNVTVSPGLILHNSSPAQPLETFVPIVEPQDITDPSTDDEREATSSHSPFHYKSSPAPPLVVMETKEESSLLPGYGGVVFPEPSPSPLSSPSRSTQQASVTIPQQSPNPDVLLVSRGEKRYEKVINCQICGKMCRTSNMARHRKRYCLLSPEREEVLGNNSLSEHCQNCGKVCRISNMARHRKRCCLLSPKREEVLGNNSLS